VDDILRVETYKAWTRSQTAVCNRHHSLDQQLCRWLLLSLDRLHGNELVMTQELIANRLGVCREGVTEGALKLQHAGLIRYLRGHITVLDRRGLDKRTCECYAVVKNEYDRLLPLRTATSRAESAPAPDVGNGQCLDRLISFWISHDGSTNPHRQPRRNDERKGWRINHSRSLFWYVRVAHNRSSYKNSKLQPSIPSRAICWLAYRRLLLESVAYGV